MNKHIIPLLLALTLLVGAVPAMAQQPANAGPPAFEVETLIAPETLSVYQGQPVTFVATTTYTTNKNENQLLHFVSDKWTGVDQFDPGMAAGIPLEAQPAAAPNQRLPVFVSTATVDIGNEPGDYDVMVKYEITLQHDESGKRTYYTTASTALITVTVMEGQAPQPEASPEASPQPAGTALNHGQIVSAWAQWKQTKGNKNFLPGGPGVYRSLNWYKAQVEYRTFHSRQEVWDYLDSIYEPAPRKNDKGPGNNKKPGK